MIHLRTTVLAAVLAAALAAVPVVAAAPAAAQSVDVDDRSGWPRSFTVGTASQGGTYFTYGSGWANLVAEELGLSGGGQVTGGPVQNLAQVQTGDMEMAMTTLGPARDALAGESPLAPGNNHDNVRALFPMYATPFAVVVLADAGLETVRDIPVGATLGFGPAGSTSDLFFAPILASLDVVFVKRNGGYGDLAAQMQDGLLDGVALAAGIPTPMVSQLEAQVEIDLLRFAEDDLEAIVDDFPVAPSTIPAATYRSLDADLDTVSMWNFAVASAELPESFVYNVMEIVLGNHERMVEIHRAAQSTRPEYWDRNTFLPFHAGAWKWYEDNGFEIPDELKG